MERYEEKYFIAIKFAIAKEKQSLCQNTKFPALLTNDIDNPAESGGSNGDADGGADIMDSLATNETLGTIHSNGTDGVLSQMLGNLQHQPGRTVLYLQGIEDGGKVGVKLHVNDGTNDSYDAAIGGASSLGSIVALWKLVWIVREK